MTIHPDTRSHVKHSTNKLADAMKRVKATNHVDDAAIEYLFPLAEQVIGGLARRAAIKRVAARNADSVWLFSRIDGERPEGFQAFLLLNAQGRRTLLTGELDLFDPPDDCLVGQSETPALIYVWATFTPGILAAGINMMIDHFSSPRYAGVDMVSWAAGIRGERAMLRSGFRKGLNLDGVERPDLFHMKRSPDGSQILPPRYDSYHAVWQRTGITVAHDIGDLFKVAAIRSAVYIGEQSCPYEEEFDGNDFAATHLLGYVDGEPAGCMRVRFFGDFVKLERLAVRKEFRTSRLAFKLVRAAVDLCRAKGVRRVYGHARTDLLDFWRSFGFDMQVGSDQFCFSDHAYVELKMDIQPSNDAVSLDDGPYRLIRPEGRWHREGILEHSKHRAARSHDRRPRG